MLEGPDETVTDGNSVGVEDGPDDNDALGATLGMLEGPDEAVTDGNFLFGLQSSA